MTARTEDSFKFGDTFPKKIDLMREGLYLVRPAWRYIHLRVNFEQIKLTSHTFLLYNAMGKNPPVLVSFMNFCQHDVVGRKKLLKLKRA